MLEFLNKLEQTPEPDATSIYLLPGLSAPEIENILGNTRIQTIPDEIINTLANSKKALFFFGVTQRSA